MKIGSLFFLFLLMMLSLNGLDIKGRLMDEQGKGIDSAVIKSGNSVAFSDTAGYFVLRKINPANPVEIKRIGFHTLQLSFRDVRGRTIILKKENYVLGETAIVSETRPSPLIIKSDQQVQSSDVKHKADDQLAEWLNDLSGVEVKGNALSGEKRTLSLSGHSPKHTGVMVDGVLLNPTGQEVDLSTINTDHIESVEIIKNNASVESGSGSMAGIIAIKTKTAGKSAFSYQSGLGSFGKKYQKIMVQKALKSGSVSFAHHLTDSANDFRFYNTNTGEFACREDNHKFQQVFSLTADTQKGKTFLSLKSDVRRFKSFLPGPYNYAMMYKNSFLQGWNVKNILTMENETPYGRHHFNCYFLNDRTAYENKFGLSNSANSRNIQNIYGLKDMLEHRLGNLVFKGGVEVKSEDFTYRDLLISSNDIPFTRRLNGAVFLSADKKQEWGSWEFNHRLSVRADKPESFQVYYSKRLEEQIRFESLIPFDLLANVGNSFMLPSFYDMYWKGDSQTVGNPELKPEKSIGYRIRLEAGDNPKINYAYWNNQTKNLIHWFRSLHGWKPGNISEAEIINHEAGFDWTFLKDQHLNVGYLRTIARDQSRNADGSPSDFNGKYLMYTPAWVWTASLALKYKNLTQTTDYKSVSSQWTTRDQLIAPLKGYELVDVHFSALLTDAPLEMRTVMSFYNIFNRMYEVYAYSPEAGYHWQIQLNINYKI